jgi:hypothetical protein
VQRIVALSLVVGLAALSPVAATAQEKSHGEAFHPGNGAGWTFGYPSIDVNAGLFDARYPFSNTSFNKFFIRAHAGMNTGIPHVALSADMNWIPSLGATPIVSFVGQVDPLSRESPFYLSLGAGLITGHAVTGDKFAGWAQAVVAYRTPIHELTPFVQAGRALYSGQKFEFLFGISHPLAPYLLHIP